MTMTTSTGAQKQTHEPILRSLELFEALFESVPEAVVFTDEQGCIVGMNAQVEKWFGYSHEELRGQPIEILVPERFREAHGRHRQDYHREPRRRAMNAGIELCGRRKDGKEFLIDVMLKPVETKQGKRVLSLIRDLTEHDSGAARRFHLAALVNSSGDAIIGKTLGGIITSWNQSAERMFGYSAQEAIGKSMSMLLPPGQEEEEADILRRLKRGETIRAYDAVRKHKDGRDIDVSVTVSPIYDPMGNLVGASKVARDITERKRTGKALQVSEIRYRRLFETAQDGILILDFATGQVVDVNQFLIDMLGYSHGELAGKKIWEIGPVKDILASRSTFADLQAKGIVRYEDLPLETKDGRRIEVEFVSNVYTVEGEQVIQYNIRDITDRKRIEAELEVARARAVASDRLSALGMMAGNIAHEVNNPLAIIHASASDLLEMAEAGQVSIEDLEKASTRIKLTADRISKIVKSLCEIAREGSGDPFQRACVAEIVDHALELCKERFRAHSVRLDTPRVDAGLRIMCREVQIAQVLLNLLQNALDAVIEVEGDRWVRLEVSSDGQSVVFAVTDSGRGVSSKIKGRIMEPFFTTKPVGKGTGLGLSLSTAIVEEHGGELKLSESEIHTCFSFSLPLSKEAENATEERHHTAGR